MTRNTLENPEVLNQFDGRLVDGAIEELSSAWGTATPLQSDSYLKVTQNDLDRNPELKINGQYAYFYILGDVNTIIFFLESGKISEARFNEILLLPLAERRNTIQQILGVALSPEDTNWAAYTREAN